MNKIKAITRIAEQLASQAGTEKQVFIGEATRIWDMLNNAGLTLEPVTIKTDNFYDRDADYLGADYDRSFLPANEINRVPCSG